MRSEGAANRGIPEINMRTACLILAIAGLGLAAEAHVFSMSCKVNALNGAFATEGGRSQAVAWCRKNHITKLWLESYRHDEKVPFERLVEARDFFRKNGFAVSGMITPTQLNDSRSMVCCWSDPVACKRLAAEAGKAALVFDEIILDDFLFTGCTCSRCRETMASWGVSDWGVFRRRLMLDVCKRYIIEAGRQANPKVQFIIKFPCWWEGYADAGYDLAAESELFGKCWIGTETRDANPNPLQSCWIVGWMDGQSGGRCGGGWYDPLDSKPEKFVEQARYTILGGAKESLIHCYDYLVAGEPGKTPFGEKMDGGHACAAAFEAEAEGLKRLADLLDGATRGPFNMRTNGVSRHLFAKGGVRYEAFQNTTDRAMEVSLSFEGCKALSLPDDGAAVISNRSVSLRPHAFVICREEPVGTAPSECAAKNPYVDRKLCHSYGDDPGSGCEYESADGIKWEGVARCGLAGCQTFTNPVIPVDWPDPAIYRGEDGAFYSVANSFSRCARNQ